MFSNSIIITLIACFTFIFTVFTILKFCYASKCKTIDIRTGNSGIHLDRNISHEDKDIPYPTILNIPALDKLTNPTQLPVNIV